MPRGFYDRTKAKPRKKKGFYIKCTICTKEFYIKPYRFKKAKFCSYKCAWKNLQGCASWNKGTKGICKSNRTSFQKGQSKLKNAYVFPKGVRNPLWTGGKFTKGSGYVYIHKPKHPFCNKKGYVAEHRLVMEKRLRRYLRPEEVVHHINGIRDDNRIKNLQLFPNNSEHIEFHHFMLQR